MNAPHRFLFDQSFDLPDPPRAAGRKSAPEPTFSKAELDAARAAGMAEGRAAAAAEAAQAIEARAAAALAGLQAALETVLDARARLAEEAQRRACETMRVLLQKLAPALSRKAPLVEIEALVAECLREAFDEPRVVLRVADGIFEAVRQRLDAITTSTGFAGKVVLLADETLGPGDARVEWAEGGAERDTRRLMREIDGALARALGTIPAPGTSHPEETSHE